MRSKKRLRLIVPILALVLAGAAYKLVLAPPADSEHRVHGEVYVLPKEFLLNLAGGRYAKLTVALVLDEGQLAGGHGGASPPEGFGPLEQEALVREIVTDELTGGSAEALSAHEGRDRYKRRIERAIDRETDVEASAVVFTDVAVQ